MLLNNVEIENSGNYLDPHFLHREVGEKISECKKEPDNILKSDVWDEEDMDRRNVIMNLFDEEDENMDSDIVNELVDVSEDMDNDALKFDECLDEDMIITKNTNKEMRVNGKKKNKSKDAGAGGKEEFKLDLEDERFRRVFEDEEFKIDVTHNLYKNNKSVKEIVREKRRRKETSKETQKD